MSRYEKLTKRELLEVIKSLQRRKEAPQGTDRLAVELEVHQAELEIQNRELREAQRLLEISRDRYANLFDFAPIGYLTLDRHGVILEINLTGASMLGNERANIAGYPFIHYLARESVERFWSHLRSCSAQALQVATELSLSTRKGDHPVQLVTVACREVEAPAAFRSALIDLADRMLAEEERERFIQEQASRREAEAASRAKDEFLAMLSHELRTPLNAIQGWLYMLRLGKLGPEEVKHALSVMERSVRTQVRLINDLLDLSRLARGKVVIEKKPVNLASVVEAALESMSFGAAEKHIQIEKRLEELHGHVEGDAQRLEQVAVNLVHNAVKFTPEGGRIEVRLERASGPEHAAAVVTIRDTGVGIPGDILPHIFDDFRQGDSTFTRSHGGLGLGLAIAKSLVEMHGGRLHAASDGEGKGATFTVTLPFFDGVLPGPRGRTPLPHPKAEDSALAGLRVLVVDDDPFCRELLSRSLEPYGAVVKTAPTAREGFEMFKDLRPRVLVCDIAMPGEDGYSLIRKVRELPPGGHERAHVIALTAFASAADRERALTSGFDAFVPKPVQPMELVAHLAQLAEEKDSAG